MYEPLSGRSALPSSSNPTESRSLGQVSRLGSTPPTAFGSFFTTPTAKRSISTSSLWSSFSLGRKVSTSSLRLTSLRGAARTTPSAPPRPPPKDDLVPAHLSTVDHVRQLLLVKVWLSRLMRPDCGLQHRLDEHDEMTFYEAAAADRLPRPAPLAATWKNLPPRPASYASTSSRSLSRRSSVVGESAGSLRPRRRGDGSVSTSKRSKRRSATSLRDLPPPVPPPTGPLPPTPSTISESTPDAGTSRDSLEDLELTSTLFYRDDDSP